MKFLIADDSKVARKKIEGFITELGYEVLAHAVDGLDAIEKAKEYTPNIITMDLEMPHLKGNMAAKEILSFNTDVNIILITSIVDKKELIEALKAGVKKILTKPISKEVFNATINDLLEGR